MVDLSGNNKSFFFVCLFVLLCKKAKVDFLIFVQEKEKKKKKRETTVRRRGKLAKTLRKYSPPPPYCKGLHWADRGTGMGFPWLVVLFFPPGFTPTHQPERQVVHGECRVPGDLPGHLEEGGHGPHHLLRGVGGEGLQQHQPAAPLVAGTPGGGKVEEGCRCGGGRGGRKVNDYHEIICGLVLSADQLFLHFPTGLLNLRA